MSISSVDGLSGQKVTNFVSSLAASAAVAEVRVLGLSLHFSGRAVWPSGYEFCLAVSFMH